jgi:DUF971 family protein
MIDTPKELRLAADKSTLVLTLADGFVASLSAELLRVESPSAEVKGHGPDDTRLVSGKKGVTITGVEPVGNYAVRIGFSDGHSTGLYTWGYLAELAKNQKTVWEQYLADLSAAGLSRDVAAPPVPRRQVRV